MSETFPEEGAEIVNQSGSLTFAKAIVKARGTNKKKRRRLLSI